ncbi:MAG TPA: hypothetical protein VJB08_00765 [Candidatus Nanoarchaeia archaeon]|nr:hypothetical protein [Candidatus Nanoarchaeia archaeon]
MLLQARRAQVTLFIIIGILLLISIGLVLYSTQQTARVDVPEIFREETPVLFQPVRSFVDNCISSTGEAGIKNLGEHGGYLSSDLSFSATAEPTESEGVRTLTNEPASAVPYWIHFASTNTCRQNCNCASEKPPLKGPNSIESRISEYVERQLPSCIDNFNIFRSQGFDFQLPSDADISVDTDIGENDVTIFVTYPFQARKEEQKQDFGQSVIRLPVNLNRTYGLAELILNTQQNYSIIEKWTTSIISTLSLPLDRNRLPPMSASQFGPGSREERWSKQQVTEKFQRDVLPYTSLLQVYPLHNYRDRGSTPLQAATFLIHNPFLNPANLLPNPQSLQFDAQFANYDANFNYIDWPIYFDITGRGVEGDSIGPETISSGFFPLIGISRRYNFYYDASFPVVVQLYDPDAFNSRGYKFYFGLEANVRDNKPINCTGSGRVSSYPPVATNLCRPAVACADVRIEATDAKTASIIDDVAVSYGIEAEQCSISSTDGAANLPSVAGGTLSFSKEGYVTNTTRATVLCDANRAIDARCEDPSVICSGETLRVELEPYRTVKVMVEKARHMRIDGSWQFDWIKVPLEQYDYAMIQLQHLKDDPSDPDLDPVFALYNDSTGPVEISIAPGNYQIDIDLMYQLPNAERTNVVFQGQTYKKDGGVFGDDVRVTTEPIPYDSDMQIGGAYRTFRFSPEFLDDRARVDTPIQFGVIASPQTFDNLYTDDHIRTAGKKEEFSSDHPGEVSIE